MGGPRGKMRQSSHAFMAGRTKEEWAAHCLDLEEAIEPFVRAIDLLDESYPDEPDDKVTWFALTDGKIKYGCITRGDLRRARTALGRKT